MALPFLPYSSSVPTQDRLSYLLKLQNEKKIRKCRHNHDDSVLPLKTTVSEESVVRSPGSSATIEVCRSSPPDQEYVTQPKFSVVGTLTRLRRSKSAEAERSSATAKRRRWRETHLEPDHLDDGSEGCSSGGNKKNYRFKGDEAKTVKQRAHKSVSSDAPSAEPNALPFSTMNWPLRSQSLQKMQHGSVSYPATTLFRRCSALFTNPFALEFYLDPTKLSYPTALLSDALCVQQASTKACTSREINVLDVGGDCVDGYIETLASIPTVRVVKAILKPKTNFSYPQYGISVSVRSIQPSPDAHKASVLLVDRPWSLSLPTESLNIVVARSLHRDIIPSMSRNLSSASALDARGIIMKTLREFHRVLALDGYIEYIYFEERLHNAGPLMEQLEPFFYENYQCRGAACTEGQVAKANAPVNIYGDVSVEDFLELIMEAGFVTKQKTVMMFPVQVLSALFTREGHRREASVSARTRTPEYRDGQDPNVLKLFECIQSECATSNPAWRCVVGWARKSAASGNGIC